MSKHKKQHFIPRSYLKAWCDPKTPKGQQPYVWQFSKDGKRVKNKSPENIFYENEMYTIKTENGERDLTLEHGLQSLEDKFCKIRDQIISKNLEIDRETKFIICAFMAAMHSRTKARRDYQKKQWQKVVDVGEKLKRAFDEAKPEQREAMINMSKINSDGPSLSFEDVRMLAKDPIKVSLLTQIEVTAPLLFKLEMAVFNTIGIPGFITSDTPCVWSDPKAYKRHPYCRTPALMYESIEITLPISPKQLILLNRQGIRGYIDLLPPFADEINRGTRFNCDEYFIVNSNCKKEYWFNKGKEPEDSWEKTHSKKKTT